MAGQILAQSLVKPSLSLIQVPETIRGQPLTTTGEVQPKTIDTTDLVQMIADELATWSGESLAHMATEIFDGKYVNYLGDDLYKVKQEN